jgi:hypothetical protein
MKKEWGQEAYSLKTAGIPVIPHEVSQTIRENS